MVNNMSKTDIYNLRKEVQTLALKLQDEYHENSKMQAKFLLVADLFKRLLKMNNEESIRSYLKTILDEVSALEDEYNPMLQEYNKTKDKSLISKLNEMGRKISGYNEVINVINKYLYKKTEVKEEPKAEVKEEPTVVAPKAPEVSKKEEKVSADDFVFNEVKRSDKIIALLRELKGLDKNTSEAASLNKQIYDLRVKREELITERLGMITDINELESVENRIVNTSDKPVSDYEADKNRYVQELRSTINAINEYYFLDVTKVSKHYPYDNNVSDGINDSKRLERFMFYINRFNSLIISLYGTKDFNIDVNGEKVSIDNILSYLETCNLSGGYIDFKSKFKESKIGTRTIDRKSYEEELSFVKECINRLCVMSMNKIGEGNITIKDCSPKIEHLFDERYFIIRRINVKMIVQRSKVGEKHV